MICTDTFREWGQQTHVVSLSTLTVHLLYTGQFYILLIMKRIRMSAILTCIKYALQQHIFF